MSVDTYLKRKNLSSYSATLFEDVRVLVSSSLANWAAALHISARGFALWKGLEVGVAPLREHVHGAA